MKNFDFKGVGNAIAKVKENRRAIGIAIVGLLIALVVGIWEYQVTHRPITSISRGEVGTTEHQETLTAKIKDGETLDVTLQVPEQVYTAEESQKMFRGIKEQLNKDILGENQSFSKIQRDMVLPRGLAQWPARIEWSSDRPMVINWEGEIGENINGNGEDVRLNAEIVYQDEVVVESWEVKVFPKILSSEETQQQKLIDAAAAENADKNTDTYILPTEVDGKSISWFPFMESRSLVIIIMTLVLVSVVLIGSKQEEFKQQQVRKEQMQIDYPEILSKLILLMNAGMSMRRSFAKVAIDYKKQKEIHKQKNYYRYAYEEFWTTYQEMEHGVFEIEAYERLGSRCGLAMYKIFSVLLIQNLKKGNQKLLEAMEREMTNAFEERKRRAKIIGEQAGTKLLLPMMLMLVIVFILLLVPAFLSF